MDTPLSRAHNLIRSVINSGGTVSKYWLEDAAEVLAKDGGLTPVAADVAYWLCKSCGIHNHKDLDECGDCGTPRR